MPNYSPRMSDGLGVNTIVLDAGHGGKDPGNLGTGKYKDTEKDIALDVVLQVGAYIQKNFPNVNVIYTRQTDVFVTLRERTNIANKANADLFLSVHCNSAANHAAHGTETYVMGLDKSEANLKLAQKENSAILLEENYEETYEGFDPNSPESLIIRVLAQQVHLDQSIDLSARIQNQYRDKVHRRDRGVKQAGFWVISYTTMPSILTELGFLSNVEEERFLNSEDGKVYMASAIYRAFRDYKNELEGVEIDRTSEEDIIVKEEKKELKKEEKKPKPAPEKQEELVYKIQIFASSKQIPLKAENFKGLENVEEYKSGGKYKYTVGNMNEYKKAVHLQLKIRENAYPEAFIIAFHNGKRITVSKALEISEARKGS